MPRPATRKETIKKNTINDMKKLGCYKPEYDRIIDIYAELNEQYIILSERLANSKYDCEVSTGADGVKKSPLVATLESLRKDILQYSDRLCLNPKSRQDNTNKEQKQSTLAKALELIDK